MSEGLSLFEKFTATATGMGWGGLIVGALWLAGQAVSDMNMGLKIENALQDKWEQCQTIGPECLNEGLRIELGAEDGSTPLNDTEYFKILSTDKNADKTQVCGIAAINETGFAGSKRELLCFNVG